MEDTNRKQPSSASTGFFQQLPTVPPQYSAQHVSGLDSLACDDLALLDVLQLYLPKPLPSNIDESLHNFARTCLDSDTLRLSVDCETNHPTLHPLTTFGEVNRVNALHTSEGWRGMKDIQTRAGIVGYGYRDTPANSQPYNRRMHQFALAHLWSASCASVSCPAAMSDGAAMLLSRRLAASDSSVAAGQDNQALETVLRESYRRLTSFEPSDAWTSGQWMTERPGGSDVSRTETVAHLASSSELESDRKAHGGLDIDAIGQSIGPYIIDGFKWFSSATDADMAILLAQTSNGLSAFYAPLQRTLRNGSSVPAGKAEQVMNGVRISRLKNKLGTKGLPTAELEIKGMRAWLLGEEGRGVREISAILNCTRLWTACGSVGGWGRGLAVTRAYAKVRKIKGEQILAENAQHIHWLAQESVKYRGCVHLAFLGVALLGILESGWETSARSTAAAVYLPDTSETAAAALRLLTPVMKAQCSLWATWGMRECMESLGGVGYCENNEDGGVMNLARSYRDGAVNSIWEGTTNIIAGDFVRVLKGKSGKESLEAVDAMLERALKMAEERGTVDAGLASTMRSSKAEMKDWLSRTPTDELLYHGRQVLQRVQEIVCAVLLVVDATLKDNARLEVIVAERWIASRLAPNSPLSAKAKTEKTLLQRHEEDSLIFFGQTVEGTERNLPQSRL